jgi:AraC-like DNA-binding protein
MVRIATAHFLCPFERTPDRCVQNRATKESMTNVRREGFPGQHLVVVPPSVRTTAIKHPLLKGLMVTDAGYFPSAEGHRAERPQGASTHIIILNLSGRGWAKSGGKAVQVDAGDIVWLPANLPHAYGAVETDPWTILWAHFCGDETPAWQQELSWAAKQPIGQFHFGRARISTLGLDKVYAHLEAGYSTRHLLGASAALRNVFCSALGYMMSSGSVKTADERTAAVREDILSDSARPYRLDELATTAGLSVPHFSLLFRRQTGYSPIEFIIRERIRKACRLLDSSQTSVAEIAAEIGFNDPYYFSRCFHRIMGASPRDYRRSVKG